MSKVTFSEIPVFKVNFYLMGQSEVDSRITVQIGENIEYLNQEFEGRVKFELNELVMDPNQAFIPDLHEDHILRNRERVNALIDPVEIPGAINIYLFDTYSINDGLSAMMGFTPILSIEHNNYKRTSPQFDRVYISYLGLRDKSTIVHEMGHFLGLSHPWEMNDVDQNLMGLDNPEAERNHMTYNADVNHFNNEQLDRMQHFALSFRHYLLSRVERQYDVIPSPYSWSTTINKIH